MSKLEATSPQSPALPSEFGLYWVLKTHGKNGESTWTLVDYQKYAYADFGEVWFMGTEISEDAAEWFANGVAGWRGPIAEPETSAPVGGKGK